MFHQSPSFMAVLRGPTHIIEFANPAYLRLTGQRDIIGKTLAEASPDAGALGGVTLLDGLFRSGAAHVARGVHYAIASAAGGPPDDRYVDFIYQPIKSASGIVSGIFLEGRDATEVHLLERRFRETLEEQVAERTAGMAEAEQTMQAEQNMRTVFETSHQSQGLLSAEGRIIYVNNTSATASRGVWKTSSASCSGKPPGSPARPESRRQ